MQQPINLSSKPIKTGKTSSLYWEQRQLLLLFWDIIYLMVLEKAGHGESCWYLVPLKIKKSWKARLGSVSQRYMVLCKNRPLKKGVFTFGANVKSFRKVVFEYLVKRKNHIDFFTTKLTFNEPLLSWRGWRPPQASWSTSQLGLKQLDLNTVLLSVFVASTSHIKLHKGNKGTEQWGMRKYGSYLLSRQTKG